MPETTSASSRGQDTSLPAPVTGDNYGQLGPPDCPKGMPFHFWIPHQPLPPSSERLTGDHLALLRQEMQALLAKRVNRRVPVSKVDCGCYSRCFLVPKKDGGLRPILDLRPLNAFLKDRFKMLMLAQVLSALDPGDWLVAFWTRCSPFTILRSGESRTFGL